MEQYETKSFTDIEEIDAWLNAFKFKPAIVGYVVLGNEIVITIIGNSPSRKKE